MDNNEDFYAFLSKGTYTNRDSSFSSVYLGGEHSRPSVTRPGTPSTSHHYSRRDTLHPDGTLNKVKFTYADKSYYLCPRPGPDVDREIKAQVFEDSISEIQGATSTWQEKLIAVTSHYNMQMTATVAKQGCAAMRAITSPQFTWTFRNILTSTFTDAGNINGANVLPNGTTYAVFDVTISPPASLASVVQTTSKAAVRVRLNTDPNNPGQIDPGYNPANVQDFMQLCMVTPGRLPLIGINRSNENPFSVEGFNDFVDKKFYECAFVVAVTALRRAVVGDGALRTADQRLSELKMTKTVNNKEVTISVQAYFERFQQILNEKPADQPYGNVTATFFHNLNPQIKTYLTANMNYTPPQGPQPTNIAELNELLLLKEEAVRAETALKQTFKQALTVFNNQRSRSSAPSYMTEPLMPLDPVHALMTTPTRGHFNPYRESHESNLSVLMGQPSGSIHHHSTPYPGHDLGHYFDDTSPTQVASPFTPAFPTFTKTAFGNPTAQAIQGFPSAGDTALAKTFLTSSGIDDGKTYVDVITKAYDTLSQVQAFVSTAEMAMQKASGMKSPMECWGCTNHPRFHAQRFHRFINCPNKDDPTVKERAEIEMKKLFGDRNNFRRTKKPSVMFSDTLSPEEIKADWTKHGFNSAAEAKTFAHSLHAPLQNKLANVLESPKTTTTGHLPQ